MCVVGDHWDRIFCLFASALIKKRLYWSTLVHGDAIDDNFSTKDMWETGSLKGKLENHHYDFFKDIDYAMKKIITYSGLP